MALVRRIARPLLAAPFIYEGVKTLQTPERQKAIAPGAFNKLDEKLKETSIPLGSDSIVRIAAGVAIGAGALYATNRMPRLAALTLLVTTSVGLAGRKKVWELTGKERQEEIHAILSDAGLLGGVMLAAVDLSGKPSLSYRMSRAIERGRKKAERKQRELEKGAKATRKAVESRMS
ncbi:DoxX family membrane protein [Devriesea agamarum]|uniref:DoxX family membrane protein n=1 Tax=Devriesea agamarum TaxID=472569 RepID=UPI00071CD345|nr:DoxX family membrane protein [Devriesea agamarum]